MDETDTSNISSEFTSEPAGVTPTPAGYRLKDVIDPADGSAPSFTDFTYVPEHALAACVGLVWLPLCVCVCVAVAVAVAVWPCVWPYVCVCECAYACVAGSLGLPFRACVQ